MKKKTILTISLLLVIVIGIVLYFWMNYLEKQGKKYEIEQIADYHYFILKEENGFGVIDDKGNIIVNAKYDEVKIPNPSKAVFLCNEGDKVIVVNEKQEEMMKEFDEVEALRLKNVSSDLIYEKKVLSYRKDGKYGLVDLDGKKLTKAVYEEIDTLQYKEGELLVKLDGKYGVINQKGKTMVKAMYDKVEADTFYSEADGYRYDGYVVSNKTEEGYRYGYVSYQGKEIFSTEFNELTRVTEIGGKEDVYLIAAKTGKYGFYHNEKQVLGNDYQSISCDKNNDVVLVQKGKKYGIYSLQGDSILPVKFSQIDINGNYFYTVEDNKNEVVFNKNGEKTEMSSDLLIIPVADDKKEEIHIEMMEGKTVYSIYQNGKKMTSENYLYLEYLYNDFFIASKESGRLGIINTSGEAQIEFKYDSIQKIQHAEMVQASMSSFKISDLYNQEMNLVSQLKNVVIINEKDYIKVENVEEPQYFNLVGKELKSSEVFANHTLFASKKDGKWGFVNASGNKKVDFSYDEVTEFNSYGFAGIAKEGKWGVIKDDGTVLLEPVYKLKGQAKSEFIGMYYQVSYGNGQVYYTNLKD